MKLSSTNRGEKRESGVMGKGGAMSLAREKSTESE